MDFQKFYAGNSFDAYSYLGAHAIDEGYVFRVYAPAALRVSLIGEFSDWKEIPMQKIYDGQFYEVLVPSAKEKQLYKYRIFKRYHALAVHIQAQKLMQAFLMHAAANILAMLLSF